MSAELNIPEPTREVGEMARRELHTLAVSNRVSSETQQAARRVLERVAIAEFDEWYKVARRGDVIHLVDAIEEVDNALQDDPPMAAKEHGFAVLEDLIEMDDAIKVALEGDDVIFTMSGKYARLESSPFQMVRDHAGRVRREMAADLERRADVPRHAAPASSVC